MTVSAQGSKGPLSTRELLNLNSSDMTTIGLLHSKDLFHFFAKKLVQKDL